MALLQDTEERQRAQRLWQAVGSLAFGDGTDSDVGIHVTNRAGQITVDTRPATPAPLTTVGGIAITWPLLLIGGALALLLVVRK